MLLDATALEDGTAVAADVCVVGAGAAGLPLALAVAHAGREVCLLESGGLRHEPDTHRLLAADNRTPRYPLGTSRQRLFGGATNHWGGLCRPLDPDDLRAHPWVPLSGWPLRLEELEPWYARALPVLDIPHGWTLAEVRTDPAAHPPLLDAASGFTPVVWLKSPPTRLGPKYRDEVERSQRLRCVLHANATEIVPNPDGTAVERIEARTLGSRRLGVTARHYVLATGGIENARLLLLSDRVVRGGLGNGHGLVGRCFMDHLNQVVGSMAIVAPAAGGSYQEEEILARSGTLRGVDPDLFGLATRPTLRAAHRLLACSLNATPDRRPEAEATAVAELLGMEHPGRAVRRYWLTVMGEQAPDPESRVFLGDERDALGQRRLVVDLRVGAADVRSVEKSFRLFALALARAGRGRVRVRDVRGLGWHVLAGHHMGTTRMADDPRRGVCDRDGRVHGIANLWIAGSSLFPTSGFSNPTLTIVALALRLAARLTEGGLTG